MTEDGGRAHRRMLQRRRRTMAVLALLGIVGLVVAAVLLRPWEPILAGIDTVDPRTSSSTPTPTPSASQPFTPIGGDPEAAAGTPCAAEQIELTPQTDRETYRDDEDVELSFRIENVGDAACTLNVGTSQQRYEVRTGDEVVYRSDDCPVEEVDQVVSLEPGVAQETVPVPWDRTRSSSSTCGAPRDAVVEDGASYHLQVTVAGIRGAESRQFILGD